jgi:hypothetical protein
VAGQPPQGYELAVLEQGIAPAAFHDAVRTARDERTARRSALGPFSGPDIADLVPLMAPGTCVRRKPVLGSGEFEWGEALVSASNPAGVPCSSLVSAMLRLIDGSRSVEAIVGRLAETSGAALEAVRPPVLTALRVLYLEGAVELAGLEASGG